MFFHDFKIVKKGEKKISRQWKFDYKGSQYFVYCKTELENNLPTPYPKNTIQYKVNVSITSSTSYTRNFSKDFQQFFNENFKLCAVNNPTKELKK